MSERSPEVALTVIANGQPRDVVVTAPTSATASEVIDELAQHVGVTDRPHARLARTGSPVRSDAPWASAIAHGDLIDLDGGPTTTAPAGGDVELLVVGGPNAGQRIPLRAGAHVVGRAGHAEIELDDPSVSREHARLEVDGTTVSVTDLRSRNGTFIEGRAITSTEVLEPGRVLEIGSTLLSIEAGPAGAGSMRPDRVVDGRIAFNRPPRLQAPYRPVTITIPAPPSEPTPRRFAIGTALIPLALGLVLFAISKGKQPALLLFALLSPTMAGYAAFDDRRSGRRSFRSDTESFRASVATAGTEATDARRREADALRAAYPDLADLVARAVERDDRLWERRPDDADHLDLRVGAADQPSAVTVEMARGGSEELRSEASAATGGATSILASVPIVVGLEEEGPLGVVGPRTVTAPLARALVTQLATLHASSDIAIGIATAATTADEWAWASWLPHAEHSRVGVPFPLIATTNEARAALADGIIQRGTAAPSIALVVDATTDQVARWAGALDLDTGSGRVVIWLAEQRRDLPNRCRAVLECREGAATLTRSDGRRVDDIVIDGVTPHVAERAARALAPMVEASGRDGSSVPREARLLDTMQVDGDLAEEVESRWRDAAPGAVAAIGRDGDGVFQVDLDRDGPHAVIGGSPGSGKSALLQTWLASLAASYPPDLVTFLIVDFKGEAAARPLAGLPHLVGVATDLTPDLTRRALVSLKAELQRRERLLAEGGSDVQNLSELTRRRPELAPPKLVIVIDEFSALKNDLPELMDELIDLARRGRALGMHLVLAAQDPSTREVGSKILSNINLRLCLRVVETSVSQDLVQVPDAAFMSSDQVGRALVRSTGGPLHVVQVAHGGAAAAVAEDSSGRIIVEDRNVAARPEPRRSIPEGETELAKLVAAVAAAAVRGGHHAPPPPWLPPLPPLLPLADVPPVGGAHRVAIGLVDRPAAQRQDPLVVDLEAHGAIAVFGTARSGKSTLLRTVAASLASHAAPDEVHLYGLDFGSGALSALEALPHCGAVVPGADDERVRRLLRQLAGLVEARRRQLAEVGASSIDDLQARTGATVPRVVLLLDEYGGLTAAYERVDRGEVLGAVPRLVTDGPGVGVHVILTVDRRGGLPTAVHSAITRRIVLPLATPDEHAALGIDARAARDRAPGRAIVEDLYEAQVAVVGSQADAASQVEAIRSLGEELAVRHGGSRVPGIATLPTHASVDDLPAPTSPMTVAIAIGDQTVAPVEVDLTEGHLLVSGPHRSGRTTSLATLAVQLARAEAPAELVLLSPRRTTLPELVAFDRVATGDDCQEVAAALAAEVDLRRDDGSERPLVVLVDDVDELFDTPASAALERVARRGRDRAVRLVLACETKGSKTFSGVVPEVRKSRRGLLLMPDLFVDGEIVGVQLPRRTSIPFVPGRGFMADRGQVELVQVASP